MPTFAKAVDNFKTTLRSSHSAGASTLLLQVGAGVALGSLAAGQIFRVVALQNPDTSSELVLAVLDCTGISTDDLTGVTASTGYTNPILPSGTGIQVRMVALDATDLQTAVNTNTTAIATNTTAIATKVTAFTITAVKTGAYTLAADEFVPGDTTSASLTFTLPSAPADGTRAGVKMVIQGSTNTVTLNCAGSDTYNKSGGATSAVLSLLSQAITLQYHSGIWYVTDDDLPLSQLDLRYPRLASANTFSAAPQTVAVDAIGNKGVIVRGASGQTANLTEWQDSGSVATGWVAPLARTTAGSVAYNGQELRFAQGTSVATSAIRPHSGGRGLELVGGGGSNEVLMGGQFRADGGFMCSTTGNDTSVLAGFVGKSDRSQGLNLPGDIPNGSYVQIVGAGASAIVMASLIPKGAAAGNYFYAALATARPMILIGFASQSAPLATMQQVSSASTARDVGYLDGGFNVSTDASRTGYSRVDAVSFNGTERGLRVDSTGTGANVALFGSGSAGSYGGGVNVVFVPNATTVPTSNPTGGGLLYVESGALKYRGSSGTVTVLAPA